MGGSVIRKVYGIWKGDLQEEGNDYQGKQLFCTLQHPPQRERQNGALGKAKAWCQTQIKDKMGFSVRTFWFPDFTVFVEDQEKNPTFICNVKEDLSVHFDNVGVNFLGFESEEAAKTSFNKYSRR